MKTIAQPAVMTPRILGLAVLAAIVVLIGATGTQVPILSNVRLDIILLVSLGMAICAQAGIGRVAATGHWSHPLSIVGCGLGAGILFITFAVLAGWKLPCAQNDQQGFLTIAILVALKMLNAITHYHLSGT